MASLTWLAVLCFGLVSHNTLSFSFIRPIYSELIKADGGGTGNLREKDSYRGRIQRTHNWRCWFAKADHCTEPNKPPDTKSPIGTLPLFLKHRLVRPNQAALIAITKMHGPKCPCSYVVNICLGLTCVLTELFQVPTIYHMARRTLWALNQQPNSSRTLHPNPQTPNPKPQILRPKTPNPKPQSLAARVKGALQKHKTLNHKTLNPKPYTPHPTRQTLRPKP